MKTIEKSHYTPIMSIQFKIKKSSSVIQKKEHNLCLRKINYNTYKFLNVFFDEFFFCFEIVTTLAKM